MVFKFGIICKICCCFLSFFVERSFLKGMLTMQVTTRENIIFFPFSFFFFFISSVNSESFLKTSVLCYTLFTRKRNKNWRFIKNRDKERWKRISSKEIRLADVSQIANVMWCGDGFWRDLVTFNISSGFPDN